MNPTCSDLPPKPDPVFEALYLEYLPWIRTVAHAMARGEYDIEEDLIQSGWTALLDLYRRNGSTVATFDILYIWQTIRYGMLGELRMMKRGRPVLPEYQDRVQPAGKSEGEHPTEKKRHTLKFRLHPRGAPRHPNSGPKDRDR